MEYDEEAELTRYVWDYCGHLMTEFEQRVGWVELARAKAEGGYPEVGRFILRRHGIEGDPEAQAALADGVEAFRRRVCRRLLAERGDEVVVNRCPACRRVARTPRARQCFWCGYDWHSCSATPDFEGRRWSTGFSRWRLAAQDRLKAVLQRGPRMSCGVTLEPAELPSGTGPRRIQSLSGQAH